MNEQDTPEISVERGRHPGAAAKLAAEVTRERQMPALVRLAINISRREGFGRPGVIPTRFNNPGDLVFAGQANAHPEPVIGGDGRTRTYARFDSAEYGWQALEAQIRLDAGRGLTLEQFIHKYAPASDGNDPGSYLAFVMRETGCQNAQTKLADLIQDPQ